MNRDQIGAIQHDTVIFSLAVSMDDRLLACGGADSSVTVWDLSDGSLLMRLNGLKHQSQSLAFSADSSMLAAVNLWGGLCVWNLADGSVVEQKPEGTGRRMRSLVYPTTAKRSRLPLQLSESIHSQTERVLARNGKSLAVRYGAFGLRIESYTTKELLGTLALDKYELTATGARVITWSSDSRFLALAGAQWAGIFKPFEQPALFHGINLPASVEIGPMAVLSGVMLILYAQGSTVNVLEVPSTPILTRWKEFQRRVGEPEEGTQFRAKRDWTWGATQWGYEGVHTYEGKLVWYSHSHDPHSGGAASEQSFTSFLEDGPAIAVASIPEVILAQVYQAVQKLI